MSDKIKVINNQNRYYNWVRQGWILEIEKEMLDDYVLHGFSLVEEYIEKKNIVVKQPTRTKKELVEILDHNWIVYDSKAKVIELEELVIEFENKPKTDGDNSDDMTDIETIKAKLVSEAIITAEELVWKADNEIMQIATDNWLI